jgi:ParB-like chromosome segregation protein Spo0J
MNPELSRRGAWVLSHAKLELSRQLEFVKAVDKAATFDELPEWMRTIIKQTEKKFGTNPAHKDTVKSTQPQINKGVTGPLEQARAQSRLAILPNPADPIISDPEKYVESPWATIPTPTVDPNVWDTARTTVIQLKDLHGTDPFLKRKKIAEHIDSMGQAVTPSRSYAMVIEIGGQQIIIDGHHRLMALWLLGLEKAPVWLVKE